MTYTSYLTTSHWYKTRRRAFRWADWKCQFCGARGINLNVHHNNYGNLFSEKRGDLIVLCSNCHKLASELLNKYIEELIMNNGALWISESKKNGRKFMSGVLEINGEKKRILIFKNDKKTQDKHPDFNIMLPDEGKPVAPVNTERVEPAPTADDFDDDIPF